MRGAERKYFCQPSTQGETPVDENRRLVYSTDPALNSKNVPPVQGVEGVLHLPDH